MMPNLTSVRYHLVPNRRVRRGPVLVHGGLNRMKAAPAWAGPPNDAVRSALAFLRPIKLIMES